ncbi:MAG: M17 family peptidase N-terminal domain-containing protein, partial [Pseudomonadales bacterium]
MKYSTTTSTLTDIRTDCLVGTLGQCDRVAGEQGAADLFRAATGDFDDKVGSTLMVNLPSKTAVRRLLIVGGLKGSVEPGDFDKAARAAASALKSGKVKKAVWALSAVSVKDRDTYWKASRGLASVNDVLYAFDTYKSSDTTPITCDSIAVHADARTRRTVARAVRHAQAARVGLDWTRDLANQPPNICNPSYLLKEARKLGRHPKVTVSALDEKKMTELGMGAFMAVSRGSDTPGKMIIIRYRGARRASDAPVVLVGKGITFDTGG